MKDLKYEYAIKLWGGFFNDEHKDFHKKEDGDFYFDTSQARREFLIDYQILEELHQAKRLTYTEWEGFQARVPSVIHRVIEFEGKQYYSKREMFNNQSYDSCKYHLEYKWTPGFNDYPLGINFDYEKVTVIKEWITGSFDPNIE